VKGVCMKVYLVYEQDWDYFDIKFIFKHKKHAIKYVKKMNNKCLTIQKIDVIENEKQLKKIYRIRMFANGNYNDESFYSELDYRIINVSYIGYIDDFRMECAIENFKRNDLIIVESEKSIQDAIIVGKRELSNIYEKFKNNELEKTPRSMNYLNYKKREKIYNKLMENIL
jgi:hypothetical protein